LIEVSGATATLIPLSPLRAATTYSVRVEGTVTDTNGNALGNPGTWIITTVLGEETPQ
jgi:hypothetical protein